MPSYSVESVSSVPGAALSTPVIVSDIAVSRSVTSEVTSTSPSAVEIASLIVVPTAWRGVEESDDIY